MLYDELPRVDTVVRPVTAPCTTTGLIKVRYGDNQQAVFNSRCQCSLLIRHMKQKCGYTDLRGELDLLSWRNGDLQKIYERKYRCEYANNSLKERETYVLVHVKQDDEQSSPQFRSLLRNLEKFKPDLARELSDLPKSLMLYLVNCLHFTNLSIEVNTQTDVVVKLHDLSKPQAREIRAKWSAVSKMELENHRVESPATGSKPPSSLLTRKSTGSKFVDLIASAMKSKDILNNDRDDSANRNRKSGRKK